MYRVHNTLSFVLVKLGVAQSYCERHVGPTLWQRWSEWVN